VVLSYKREYRLEIGNNRLVSLTSVFYKQMERVIAGYLRIVGKLGDLRGFRTGYSCVNKVVIVCQDMADSLDERVMTGTVIIDLSKAFDLVPHDKCLRKSRQTEWI